ncbi:MAG: hypothetical protein RL685_29 [Pseudomonadota bacterium]|jgi:purine-binding chemotaxis protein CheW
MDSNERLQARLRSLRSEFDQSFAHARQSLDTATIDFLLIRVAGEPYALRLTEVAALESDRVITPVPSAHRALLGVAGLRGSLVAVFDLAQLLGHDPQARPAQGQGLQSQSLQSPGLQTRSAASNSRWLVLVKGSLAAMAFGEFEGQRRLGSEALATTSESGQLREVLRISGVARPIVPLTALAASCEPPLVPGSDEESR